jgi:hypothetical protein
MKVRGLLELWEQSASGELTPNHYQVRLPIEDAARLAALSEMFPRRTIEQLITDLLTAALGDLESTMPYIEGNRVISEDEHGNPIYGDLGPTPRFLALKQKHLMTLKPQ